MPLTTPAPEIQVTQYASLFSQILALFNRGEFAEIVRKHHAERHAKGFTCWEQFVAMLFCQTAHAKSLREICGGLACCIGKLKHLGMAEAPKKSTLAYANEHRPWEVYQDLFNKLLERCQDAAAAKTGRKRRFRFKNRLLSLDASTIDLCLSLFPWADFKTTKGAVKLHLLLDHEGYLPVFALITEGNVHEVTVARLLKLPVGSIVVMDRGYNDYAIYGSWTAEGVFFVTRLKDDAVYQVVERRQPPQNRNVLADEIIQLTGKGAWEKCPCNLRRVVVWDPIKEEEVVFLTNHLTFGASTIAAIYRDRWQIEVFFKELKQNLKVKTFVGTSPNALKTQIWTALIAMLVLKYLQLKSSLNWSLSNLIALLRWNLFTYRDLWEWINRPYETPPVIPTSSPQLTLSWTAAQ
jgi:hypothetical protein